MALHSPLLHRLDAIASRQWELYRFALPSREGLVVCIEGKWGEISPLKGRSKETLQEAEAQLKHYLESGEKTDFFPSVQFGLESVFEEGHFPLQVPLYALCQGTPEEVLREADIALGKGHTTLKIKVGLFGVQDNQFVIKQLLQKCRLRVDCNRNFSFAQAMNLFAPFDPALFDYIEDPTYEEESLPQFTHPFALDENVEKAFTSSRSTYPSLTGIILKPTLLGGKKGCRRFIHYAQQHGLKITLSSCFESSLGLLQIVKLAHHFNLTKFPLGLDTRRYLNGDIVDSSPRFDLPTMRCNEELMVLKEHLQKVAHGTTPLSPI